VPNTTDSSSNISGKGFTDLFINRPVLALVLSAVMLLLGLQAASQLTLREYPEVEKSVIFVLHHYSAG